MERTLVRNLFFSYSENTVLVAVPIIGIYGIEDSAAMQEPPLCLTHIYLIFITVFGKVTEGLDVVDKIEGVGSQSGATAKPVFVKDCGEL